MKKFYFLIAAVFFLAWTSAVSAQTPYMTIPDDGTQHLVSDPATWAAPNGQPPNPCNNCIITVLCQLKFTPVSGTLTLFNSKLVVDGGASVEVDESITLVNTAVVVGNDPTTPASVIINDQIYLQGTSTIQLANNNCFLDTRNLAGISPIQGTLVDFASGSILPGIYDFSSDVGAQPDGYYIVLNQFAIGNPGGTVAAAMYTINCGGTGPACARGVIYGPALTQENAAGDFFGFEISTVLPVDLVQFLANRNADETVSLSWSTAQEVNSSYYDVERSADLASWTKLGSVAAKGFSSVTVNYGYKDATPLPGTGFYRLKMVDLDGKFKYSKVISVSSDPSTQALVIYSNPFTDEVRVKVNIAQADNLTLTITDMVGKSYLRQNYNAQAGDNFINLTPSATAQGIYILHIRGNTYDKTVKLLKQ
jgi:Secretion system C-terminal sorting domain